MRTEIIEEDHCPKAGPKPKCRGCPKVFNSAEVNAHCDKIIYCLTASDDDYARAAFQFNTANPKLPDPCVVVMADNVECLKAVIPYVKTHHKNLQIAVRSGRHSYIDASTASKGVILDVSRFKHIEQNKDGKSMRVGAGITLGDLYSKLWAEGLLYPGGTCPTVGLSGLTLGGGQGVTGRKYGLSSDQVVSVKMINAAGKEVVASSIENTDLFWALRGGGNGNFGVVYEFTLNRYKIPGTSKDYLITFPNSGEWQRVIDQWQGLITSDDFENDKDTWSQLAVSPASLHVAFHISGGDREQYIETIKKGTTQSELIGCEYTPGNYSGSIAFWAGCTANNACGTTEDLNKCLQHPTDCGGRAFRMNSGYQSGKLKEEGIKKIIHYMVEYDTPTPPCVNATLLLDTLGGKINEFLPHDTAFPHRENTFGYQFIAYLDYGCAEDHMEKWLNDFHREMLQFMSSGKYRNYANPNVKDYNQDYFMKNYPRLVQVKNKHDEHNVFRYSQSIPLSVKIERAILHYWPYAVAGIVVITMLVLWYRARSTHQHGEKQS